MKKLGFIILTSGNKMTNLLKSFRENSLQNIFDFLGWTKKKIVSNFILFFITTGSDTANWMATY